MHTVRTEVRVEGVVQGVGFRPFVYALATGLGLTGLVGNDLDGVFAEVEGPEAAVAEFLGRLEREAPPLARIERVTTRALRPVRSASFVIAASESQTGLRRTLSPARTRTVPLGPCEEPLACDLTSHDLLCCAGTLTAVVHVLEDTLPGAITCAECGTRHEPETWRHLARRLRRGEESWLTAAQLSQLLRVPLKTLQRWALEDQWRFTETRPRRYQHEDAQASYDAHRLEESA